MSRLGFLDDGDDFDESLVLALLLVADVWDLSREPDPRPADLAEADDFVGVSVLALLTVAGGLEEPRFEGELERTLLLVLFKSEAPLNGSQLRSDLVDFSG